MLTTIKTWFDTGSAYRSGFMSATAVTIDNPYRKLSPRWFAFQDGEYKGLWYNVGQNPPHDSWLDYLLFCALFILPVAAGLVFFGIKLGVWVLEALYG